MEMDIDVSQFSDRATHLEETQSRIRTATDPAAAEIYVGGQLDEFKRQFDFQGVNVAPTSTIATAEQRLREEYDDSLRRSIVQYETDFSTFEREIDAAIAQAEEVAGDPSLTTQNDSVRLLARSVQLHEQEHAERRMQGKTRRQILLDYSGMPDGESARVYEREVLNGFQNVTVVPHKTDVEAITELKAVVKARRTARARAGVPEAFEARSRIAALKKSVTSSVLRNHMKSGRGVALRLVGKAD